ncbi:hypothetical protein LJR071_000852 [Pseudomonas sp. LjRoot71]|uniref:hypothetical protein n=1 Tax=Pseudomonas sp. LjRoot71 TaxID=3342336 RepID=UPI003ED13468
MSAFWYWLGGYLLAGILPIGCAYGYSRLISRSAPADDTMTWKESIACFLAVLILWPLVIAMLANEWIFNRRPPTPVYREWVATPASLTEPLSRERIEQLEIYSDPLNAVPALPFGHLNDAWQRFCQQLQETDQLWAFRIDAGQDTGLDYDKRYGIVEGYALLRGGEICGEFYARMD